MFVSLDIFLGGALELFLCINNAAVIPHLKPTAAVRSQRIKSKGKQRSFKVAFSTQRRPKTGFSGLSN
jgi:hypothetical protein